MPDVQMVELTKDQVGEWHSNLEKSRAVRKQVEKWWTANMEAYSPAMTTDPDEYGRTLNTNRDFTLVERKKADLFYQTPHVTAVPSPLFAGQEMLLETHENILNHKLGTHGVDAKDLVHRALFDVLCPAGTGWSVMGYESATVATQSDVLGPNGQPQMAPVPVYEQCFWKHLSPKQGLIPHGFRSTKWDDAPWLGYDIELPVAVLKAKGWVDEKYSGVNSKQDELHFEQGMETTADNVGMTTIIFYRSVLYRQDRPHPLHQSLLVFVDGVDGPVEHKDSPYQTIQPDGSLSPDSLIGFPIHPLTIRQQTDSAYVASDCTISRPLVNELNRFRGQMVEQRDANVMRWMYNTDALPQDALNKIVRSPIGGFIGVPGDAFHGEGAIKELPHGNYPRENFEFNNYLDADLARTHGIDANQAGVDASGDVTATEANLRQGNANARLGLERGIVLDWYIKGVTKYSALVQRFLSVKEASTIVGQDPAQGWDAWRHKIPASLAFTALPDSTVRMDLASERKRAQDEYSFLRRDPLIDPTQLLKHTLPRMGYSISMIAQPQPPKPEPTRPTFNFTGDDLNPSNPQFAIVMEILRQAGVAVSPEAVQEAQAGAMNAMLAEHAAAAKQPTKDAGKGAVPNSTEHPGKMTPAESLSKHQSDITGDIGGPQQTGGVM